MKNPPFNPLCGALLRLAPTIIHLFYSTILLVSSCEIKLNIPHLNMIFTSNIPQVNMTFTSWQL